MLKPFGAEFSEESERNTVFSVKNKQYSETQLFHHLTSKIRKRLFPEDIGELTGAIDDFFFFNFTFTNKIRSYKKS